MASDGNDPDEALLAGVGRGEPSAVRTLLDRRLPRILALARRMLNDPGEAEDVAQETFLRAWKQARAWKPGGARFDTWLHRVALNLCYDRLRRRREIATDAPPEQVDTGPAPDAGLIGTDLSRRVEAALAALPPRQREADGDQRRGPGKPALAGTSGAEGVAGRSGGGRRARMKELGS